MNGAKLLATCSTGAPSWQWLSPAGFDMSAHADDVHNATTVYTLGVAPTCLYSQFSEPCASDGDGRPALFYCTWAGSAGAHTTGPVEAHTIDFKKGVRVAVNCPIPSFSALLLLHPTPDGAFNSDVNLSLSHYAPPGRADSLSIPFEGLTGGQIVRFHNLIVPPPPAAPPPPSPPIECRVAIYLANDDSRRQYGSSFWTTKEPVNAESLASLATACSSAPRHDVKVRVYVVQHRGGVDAETSAARLPEGLDPAFHRLSPLCTSRRQQQLIP